MLIGFLKIFYDSEEVDVTVCFKMQGLEIKLCIENTFKYMYVNTPEATTHHMNSD